jgi:hypothetical protein
MNKEEQDLEVEKMISECKDYSQHFDDRTEEHPTGAPFYLSSKSKKDNQLKVYCCKLCGYTRGSSGRGRWLDLMVLNNQQGHIEEKHPELVIK